MMKYTVYFLKGPINSDLYRQVIVGLGDGFLSAVAEARRIGMYEKVASLRAANLESVFAMCNSVDAYWPDTVRAAQSAVFYRSSLRSMSVGDLIESEDGQTFVVACVGFRTLP